MSEMPDSARMARCSSAVARSVSLSCRSSSPSSSGCTVSVTWMNGTTPCSTTSGSPESRAAATMAGGALGKVRPSSSSNAATPRRASERT